jgi:hypothetical protein
MQVDHGGYNKLNKRSAQADRYIGANREPKKNREITQGADFIEKATGKRLETMVRFSNTSTKRTYSRHAIPMTLLYSLIK